MRIAGSLRRVLFLPLLGWAASAVALDPAIYWSQRFGSTDTDLIAGVAQQSAGYLMTTGSFFGSVDYGTGSVLTSAGSFDVSLVRFTSAGIPVWAKRFGGSSADQGRAVAVSIYGDSHLAATFNGTVPFGGPDLVSAGSGDIALASFTAAGGYRWSKRFGGPGIDVARAVECDASGNLILAGEFHSTIDLGGGTFTAPVDGKDGFVAKFDADGNHQWSRSFSASIYASITGICSDVDGNVFVTGYYEGDIDAGGGLLSAVAVSDCFLAKYDATGAHVFSRSIGSFLNDFGADVVANSDGDVILLGEFNGTVDFGGGAHFSSTGQDMFLAAYDAAGQWLWSRNWGSTSHVFPARLGIDGHDQLTVVGTFLGEFELVDQTLIGLGGGDDFLLRLDAQGNPLWSAPFATPTADNLVDLAVDHVGTLYLAGHFSGGMPSLWGTASSAGSTDQFLIRLHRNSQQPRVLAARDVPNDQGRRIRIDFERSGFDHWIETPLPIHSYEIYRRDALHGKQDGWTFVASAPAHGDERYSVEAATLGDSTISEGPYPGEFLVRATGAAPASYFDSRSFQAWSLDNLAPPTPTRFGFDAGALAWDRSPAADFDYFTVYGGSGDFASAIVLGYATAPLLELGAQQHSNYWVSASDFAGNESAPAGPLTLTANDEHPRSSHLALRNWPNPFNPRTSILYELPSAGVASLAIYDQRGREVVELFAGREHAAGAHRIEWDGRDAAGRRLPSGVYFARLGQGGQERARKLVLVQ